VLPENITQLFDYQFTFKFMVFSKQGYQKVFFSTDIWKWNSLHKKDSKSEMLNAVRKEAEGSVQTYFINLKQNMSW